MYSSVYFSVLGMTPAAPLVLGSARAALALIVLSLDRDSRSSHHSSSTCVDLVDRDGHAGEILDTGEHGARVWGHELNGVVEAADPRWLLGLVEGRSRPNAVRLGDRD